MLVTKKLSELKPHPMNEFLFDDIEGEKWEEFLTSVQRLGVITPLVITSDGTIISGHQRYRACLALGIEDVRCKVWDPRTDDDLILALIESNIRQRGVINSPSVKLGRIIAELERIHGADKRAGGGNHTEGTVTKKAILEHIGVDKKVANCSKAIARMPEEIQELVEGGSISPRIAYDVLGRLSNEELIEIAKTFDPLQRYVQSEVKAAVEHFFPKAKQIDEMQQKLADYEKNDGELELREQLREVQAKERQTYEDWQAEKRARRKDRAEFEKRMDAMEQLLDESGGDHSAELARLTEERDQYMKDADAAQADADIDLVISLIGAMSGAFAAVANDPRPLTGQSAGTASMMINQLEEKLEQIRERLKAGDEDIAAADGPETA